MKNRIREMVFLSALVAFAGLPALAQDVAPTVAVATPASAAASPAPKPPSWGVPEGRTFFPHDWVRGYVNFDVAPQAGFPIACRGSI